MLDDILNFAAVSLVDNGRVSIWMPTANDEDVELRIPSHAAFELVATCIQVFNKCEAGWLVPKKRIAKTCSCRVKETSHL